MATERNVVDFKIHNISEEKFQELKDAGQIDPNAIYCTPDTTKIRLDELDTKTTLLESKTTLLDTKTTSLENNKQDKGDYATNTALSQGLSQKQDIATAVNYDNITNCITEIPQDIKLGLADGAITLKANSKLYQPNGSGVFTPIEISSDKTRSDFSAFGSGTYLLFYSQSYGGLIARNINNCVSGATDTSTATSHTWYDTTNNKIKTYSNGSYTLDDLTLPLCAFENTYGTGATSIKHVFNGFGHIGLTVFVLPGVKGLVPNGRNTDGTLKNTTRTTTAVSVYTPSIVENSYEYQLAYNGTLAPFYSRMTYNAEENINYNANGTPSAWAIVGSVKFNNNAISEFNPKTVFHAVDYNDWETTTDALKNTITISAPAGMVSPFAGKTAPTGWLKCDGSAVSRTTYASLFAAIGTTYGAGNGSTTFNLPNLMGYVPLGMDGDYIGKTVNGALPNILGTFTVGAVGDASDFTGGIFNTGGAFSSDLSSSNHSLGGGSVYTSNRRATFDASRYNAIYSSNNWFSGTRVIPASVGMTYCIKY